MISINSVRLYLPDDILASRLGPDVKPLADYIQAIQALTIQHWSDRDIGGAKGLFVAVGVKPNGTSGSWSNAVEGSIDAETLWEFDALVAGVPPLQVMNGPIAFGLEFTIGDHPVPVSFPELPTAWSQYTMDAGKAFQIPDELFLDIWPD